MTQALKLRAESKDDLVVISSALQDAILKVGEIRYDGKGRYLSLRLSRFRNEDDDANERIQTGLRIDSVLGVKSRGIERGDPEAYAVLLSVIFDNKNTISAEDPGGFIRLILAGGGEIDVQTECIDVTLADISEARKTDKLPIHYDG